MYNKFDILNRPLSPHLIIYSAQFSSIFSIWHRISSLCITFILFLFLLGLKLILLSFISFNFLIFPSIFFNYIKNCFYIFFLLIVVYHVLNGIRHIIWDIGFMLHFKSLIFSSFFIFFILALIFLLNLLNL